MGLGPFQQRAVLVMHVYGSRFPVIHYCIAHAAVTAAFVTGTFCLSSLSNIDLCCLLSTQKLCKLNAEHPCSGSLMSGVVAQENQDIVRVFSGQVGNTNLCHQSYFGCKCVHVEPSMCFQLSSACPSRVCKTFQLGSACVLCYFGSCQGGCVF